MFFMPGRMAQGVSQPGWSAPVRRFTTTVDDLTYAHPMEGDQQQWITLAAVVTGAVIAALSGFATEWWTHRRRRREEREREGLEAATQLLKACSEMIIFTVIRQSSPSNRSAEYADRQYAALADLDMAHAAFQLTTPAQLHQAADDLVDAANQRVTRIERAAPEVDEESRDAWHAVRGSFVQAVRDGMDRD